MNIDEFIRDELERTGKTSYTLEDVERLTERWIQYKQAAAAPFPGWAVPDADVDRLLGIDGPRADVQERVQ